MVNEDVGLLISIYIHTYIHTCIYTVYIYIYIFGHRHNFNILAADQNIFKLQLYNEYGLKVNTLIFNLYSHHNWRKG